MHPPACRVTLQGPARRLDLVIPSSLPMIELLPRLVELGVGERADPLVPLPWRVCGALGSDLDLERTLRESGVRDGDLLVLRHEHAPVLGVLRSDPVVALAGTVDAMAGDWTARRRTVLSTVVLAVALSALLSLLAVRVSSVLAGVVSAGVAGLLLASAAFAGVARRSALDGPLVVPVDRAAACALADLSALPLAFAGLAVASGAAWGIAAATCAVTVGGLVGLALATTVRAARDVSAGLAVGGVLAAAAAGVAASPVGPTKTVAVALVLALALLPTLPGFTLRVVGAVRSEGSAGAARTVSRAGAARTTLTAAAASLGASCAGLAAVAAAGGGASGRWLAAVAGLVLLLRSRAARRTGDVLALAVPGVGALVAAGVLTGRAALQAGHPLLAVVPAAVLALLALVAAHPLARPAYGSPAADRLVRRVEGMSLLAAVPLAFAVLGAFGAVADAANGLI